LRYELIENILFCTAVLGKHCERPEQAVQIYFIKSWDQVEESELPLHKVQFIMRMPVERVRMKVLAKYHFLACNGGLFSFPFRSLLHEYGLSQIWVLFNDLFEAKCGHVIIQII
jgi:hypothetical protein